MGENDKNTDTPFVIGTSGWYYDDWIGPFYPEDQKRYHKDLQFFAYHFRCVEINSTFYHQQPIRNAEKWCGEVSEVRDDFLFSVKCWQELTHERPGNLPSDEIQHIKDFCGVFSERDMFCGLLLQFPFSFHSNMTNWDYLARLLENFSDCSPIVEIRSDDWMQDREFFQILRDHGAAFCNIDQPQLRNCPKSTAITTASTAYLRVHGRNKENWFNDESGRDERYDYLYGPDEIKELEDLARDLAHQADQVVVVANNHYRAQAAADALLLRQKLEGHADTASRALIEAFPQLREVQFRSTLPEDQFEQPDLFE